MDSFHAKMDQYSFSYFNHEDIKLTKRLGSGAIGEVHDAEIYIFDNNEPLECIVKKMTSGNYNYKDEIYDDIINEITVGHKFMGSSNHLIDYYGYCLFEENKEVVIYFIMEKLKDGLDLYDYLQQEKFWKEISKKEYDTTKSNFANHDQDDRYWEYILPYKEKCKLTKEMCYALQEIHARKITHCDLKPNNMVCYTDSDNKKNIKLIDFGSSIEMKDKSRVKGGCELATPGYMPREMYDGIIDYKSDVYSLVVSIIDVWCGSIWGTSEKYTVCRKDVLNGWRRVKDEHHNFGAVLRPYLNTDVDNRPPLDYLIQKIETLLS